MTGAQHPAPCELRPLRSSDLAGVASLDAELFEDEAWGVQAWAELLAGPSRRGWVLVGPDGLAGYALTGTVGDFAELLRLGVRPARRRDGLASRLLDAVVAAALADGAERLLLEVSAGNAAGLGLYRARGFEQIDVRPRYYRDGSDALVLERRLEASERMEP
ncbi:GNAT family N-acetyltransferase [Nocardioides campestrisoli]|uniref:GNAT family N-acetyltransferase n=1 Tax=Nocardioides campestrisoli TaxID=2736757 RepID=UPI0015E6D23D|nr:GNAT family N-acetyltransferase [Nocardioides campestrisoli]